MSTHTTTIHMLVSFGRKEIEIPADVRFGFTPGYPATGPSYSCGGEPACPAEVEIMAVELTVPCQSVVGGVIKIPAPSWLVEVMQASDDMYEQLSDAVPDGPDPDDVYVRRRDDDELDRIFAASQPKDPA